MANRPLPPPHRLEWSVHPGEVLREELAERGIRQVQLAHATGYTPKHVNQVVMGHDRLTPGFALAIEAAIGLPAHVLYRMQADRDLWEVVHGMATPR